MSRVADGRSIGSNGGDFLDRNTNQEGQPARFEASGVVAVPDGFTIADGSRVTALFAKRWTVFGDRELGMASWTGIGARPIESWHMAAVAGRKPASQAKIIAIVPSSRFGGFVRSKSCGPGVHRLDGEAR